jgi:hypothetical protein
VQFSQGQLRETLGISVETFRHWKRVLPPFAERKRYTPRFTVGDLLAAGVLHRLTDECGIRPSFLPEISKGIVDLCNASTWAALVGKSLVIEVSQRTCRLQENGRVFGASDVVIVCPLSPVLDVVRNGLARIHPTVAQHELLFPTASISQARARRRRA